MRVLSLEYRVSGVGSGPRHDIGGLAVLGSLFVVFVLSGQLAHRSTGQLCLILRFGRFRVLGLRASDQLVNLSHPGIGFPWGAVMPVWIGGTEWPRVVLPRFLSRLSGRRFD